MVATVTLGFVRYSLDGMSILSAEQFKPRWKPTKKDEFC
jgi:hypothetical protein